MVLWLAPRVVGPGSRVARGPIGFDAGILFRVLVGVCQRFLAWLSFLDVPPFSLLGYCLGCVLWPGLTHWMVLARMVDSDVV